MQELNRRIERLEDHGTGGRVHDLADRLARDLDITPSELMADARSIADREAQVGRPEMLRELAASVGVSPAHLLAEVAEMEQSV